MSTINDDGAAKLSSLFGKKKKKGGVKSMNANVIVKEIANAPPAGDSIVATSPRAVKVVKTSEGSPLKQPKTKSVGSPALSSTSTTLSPPTKTLSDLTIGEKKDQEHEKQNFQWAKQPKKYKSTSEEGVAKSWEEQEERNRVAKRINLSSERAFPTLGMDSTTAQLSNMKIPEKKSVQTKNVWASLGNDEDED